jgi:hypothetical protein
MPALSTRTLGIPSVATVSPGAARPSSIRR